MTGFRLIIFILLTLVVHEVYADNTTSITIINSGSTNTKGYKIDVLSNGSTIYDDGTEIKQASLPLDQTQRLFEDVQLVFPFTQITPMNCMKSVSFGTRTTLLYGNQEIADVSCPGNPKVRDIYQDINNLQKTLGVGSVPRRR